MLFLYILLFVGSCLVLFWAGKWLVKALLRIAKFLGWREFVVAFCVMAFAGAVPNLFVGIKSVVLNIPQLSFGDVVGGNVVDLTIAVALAVLVAKTAVPAQSRTIRTSTIFTFVIAVLPLVLILDGVLGRGDGLLLLGAFVFYIFWLFSREERFKKVYNPNEQKEEIVREVGQFGRDLGRIILALLLFIAAAEGVVRSAVFIASFLNMSLPLIGILVVGLGNALPEIYFAIASAKKGQTGMILGNLMGSVIVPVTLVLGIVALLSPIEIFDFSSFAIARIILIISAVFFLIIVRTGQKISKKEAMFLLGIYILFVVLEIVVK